MPLENRLAMFKGSDVLLQGSKVAQLFPKTLSEKKTHKFNILVRRNRFWNTMKGNNVFRK